MGGSRAALGWVGSDWARLASNAVRTRSVAPAATGRLSGGGGGGAEVALRPALSCGWLGARCLCIRTERGFVGKLRKRARVFGRWYEK